jgi:hypothetical protein
VVWYEKKNQLTVHNNDYKTFIFNKLNNYKLDTNYFTLHSFNDSIQDWTESKIEVLVGGDIEKEQLRNRVDSLHDELFISKVQNGRYELTLEHLNEVNPKAALEFVNFMNHETE